MTEQEWLVSDDPGAMLDWATRDGSGPGEGPNRHIVAKDGKLRQFICACLAQSDQSMLKKTSPYGTFDYGADGERLGDGAVRRVAYEWVRVRHEYDPPEVAKADILREVIGNPFNPVTLPVGSTECRCDLCGRVNPAVTFADMRCLGCGRGIVRLCPGTCPWLTPTVIAIVRECVERKDFTELPVAADALEDAGCDNEVLLQHLRGFDPCPKAQSVKTDYRCPVCRKACRYRSGVGFEHEKICGACVITWEPGETLDIPCKRCDGAGWKKIPRHHVGCWACELILEGTRQP